MGEKDKIEKLLEDYPDVFADIINVLVYQGEEVVKPEELRTTNIRSQLHHTRSKNGIMIFGKNQTIKDKRCPSGSKLSFSDVKERCKRIL